jgi:uncharacterized protein (DUF849 family)
VLVKACLNGSRGPGEHPALPVTAEELAADAVRVAQAGAGAVHVHPRDGAGTQTLEPGPCGEAVAAIRASAPGLPVGLTTAAWIAPHPRRLAMIERWDPAPDFASVNVSEEGTRPLVELLAARGIGIEAGVTGVDDARTLAGLEGAPRLLRVLVELDEEEDGQLAADEAMAVEAELRALGIEAPRLHHAGGIATWKVIAAAVALGRDVRVGLEDTLVLPDGSPARDNADLVAAALEVVGRRGAPGP